MSKMVPVTGRQMIRVLEKAGFWVNRWKGSHAIMDNGDRIIPVSCHSSKTMPPGTQRAIIHDAGLTVDEFNELLKK